MRALTLAVLLLSAPAMAAEPEREEDLRNLHRHAFLLGGLFAAAGAGFGHAAREDARLASDAVHARQAVTDMRNARTSATGANICFAVAGVAVVFGLVMELRLDF